MAKIKGDGVRLYLGDGESSEVFTLIGQVRSVTEFFGKNASEIDTTALSDAAKTYLGGKPDYGRVAGQVFYDPDDATHDETDGIMSKIGVAAPVNFWMTIPTSTPTYVSFSAVVLNFTPGGAEIDGVLMADFELKVSGTPDFGASAPTTS